MISRLTTLVVIAGVFAIGGMAVGQEVIVYQPVAEPLVVSRPTVAYSPVYVEQPVVVARPPVTVYRPVTPAPRVTVYSPAVPAPAVVPASPVVVTAARPVVVRSKVYVPGQPVRNVLRAVTP